MSAKSRSKDVNVAFRAPTLHEVAAASKVSIGTVSRVSGGHPRVAPETRARVLAAMSKLGYQPNAAARAMRTNQTMTVGFLIPDLTNPVFARVAAGAEAVLAPAGYLLVAFSSNRSSKREVEFLRAARQRHMDGLIVTLGDETAKDTLDELRLHSCPLVMLDRDVPLDADTVYSEHAAAMETLVDQLVGLGHRRIALIAASPNIRPGRERVAAFQRAMQRAGVPLDARFVRAGIQSAAFGAEVAHEWLTRPRPPTAIIAAGSDIFQGALRAVRQLGLSIPGDISFVGADDTLLGELVEPPLTVIERDMEAIGREAATLLLARLRGVAGPPRRVQLASTVLLRRSIGPPKLR